MKSYFERSIRHNLDTLYSIVRRRLEVFSTEESCGRWNSTLFDNLREDRELDDAANEVHGVALSLLPGPSSWAFDGASLDRVQIELQRSITLQFSVWVLSHDGASFPVAATYLLSRPTVEDTHYQTAYFLGEAGQNDPLRVARASHQDWAYTRPLDSIDWAVQVDQQYRVD